MKNNFFNPIKSLQSPTSNASEQPATETPSKKRFGKKLYVSLAAVAVILIILTALFWVPQSNANVLPLGVHYSTGEKLTYDVTTTMSSQSANTTTNLNEQGTLTVEVISFSDDTYTLNYTSTTSLAGFSTTTSRLLDVKDSDMVNVLTLLPVALQQYSTNLEGSSPIITALFNQSEAKVGDTWTIPLTANASSSGSAGNLTVTFKAIQDLAVPAGNFKVFRIDFSTTTPTSPSNILNLNLNVTGQSYLEYGTCKQVKSTLEMNMNSGFGNSNYNIVISYTSTLTKDTKP